MSIKYNHSPCVGANFFGSGVFPHQKRGFVDRHIQIGPMLLNRSSIYHFILQMRIIRIRMPRMMRSHSTEAFEDAKECGVIDGKPQRKRDYPRVSI